jgi:hypothetical protein
MDQHTREHRFARCYALWAAATNFRRHATDPAAKPNRRKPTAQTVLKALALTATLAAGAYLGHQAANGDINPITLTFTILAILGTGLALADHIGHATHTVRRALGRLRPMTGRRFRKQHGDPAGWDDDEYEAYFAITATQDRSNIHPAA